jgi:hypothetical protein
VALVGGGLLVVALTLLPWRAGGATAIQAPGAAFGIGAALAAAGAVAWLAIAVLAPRPPVPDPGRALAALWGAALALAVLKLVSDTGGLRVGAWTSCVLAGALVALAVRRRRAPAPATS